MSGVWALLVPAAMVGTDRQPALPGPWPGAIGHLVADAAQASRDPASALLRAAAVLAVCELAGSNGLQQQAPLPAPPADETLPTVGSGPTLALFEWTLRGGPLRLQHEALFSLARARCRLPPTLLPLALDTARRSTSLRPALLPVLGARGMWLAAQRDDWRYAAGVDEDAGDDAAWSDGTAAQRREFLIRQRRADPAAGRRRLDEALEEMPAKERADLAATLATGLGPDDEHLLETLRADRSRDVRRAALELLLRLPEAAHTKRAMNRLEPLLTHERVLFRKRWLIEAPHSEGADWKGDNIDTSRPKHEALGERAWWLYQLVRQVPLPWWNATTGLTAAELLAWAAGTDWADALQRGWHDALLAAPEPAWCEAFLEHAPASLRDDPASVLALLPVAARDRHWQRTIAEHRAVPLQTLLPRILAAHPAGEALSAGLSLALADLVRQRAHHGAFLVETGWRELLPDLCAALHPDALDTLAALRRDDKESPAIVDTFHIVAKVIAARRAFAAPSTFNLMEMP